MPLARAVRGHPIAWAFSLSLPILARPGGGGFQTKGQTMANMAHCRFHNTLQDLKDCWEHIDETDLSDAEHKARANLLRACAGILDDFGLPVDGLDLKIVLDGLDFDRAQHA